MELAKRQTLGRKWTADNPGDSWFRDGPLREVLVDLSLISQSTDSIFMGKSSLKYIQAAKKLGIVRTRSINHPRAKERGNV